MGAVRATELSEQRKRYKDACLLEACVAGSNRFKQVQPTVIETVTPWICG